MCSDVLTEELLKDHGDVLANLLLQGFGESGPDAVGGLGHDGHSLTRAMSCWTTSRVSLVRECAARGAARSVEISGMRSRNCSRYSTSTKPSPRGSGHSRTSGKRRPKSGWVGSMTSTVSGSISVDPTSGALTCERLRGVHTP